MSPDPYRARGWPRGSSEVRTPLEQFVQRLRDLGATEDEVSAVVVTWDDLEVSDDPEAWTLARRDAMVRTVDDATLRQMIVDGRREYAIGTTTEEEVERVRRLNAEREAYSAAYSMLGETVGTILEWVGSDPVRAKAMAELEQGQSGRGRKTLLTALEPIHGGLAVL